jgi:hypothetical protein
MSNSTLSTIQATNKKEWLALISFAERAMGSTDLIVFQIKKDNVLNKNTKSVAAFYKDKLGSKATFNRDLPLKQLLKNENFISIVLNKTKDDVALFTEVYNRADWAITTYNSPEDNIYIKCNPVDSNDNTIDLDNNVITTKNSSQEVLQEASNLLAPDKITNNIGGQIVVGVIFLAISYLIGNYIFIRYPRRIIDKSNLEDKPIT